MLQSARNKWYSITARDGDSNRFTSCRRKPKYTTYASFKNTYGHRSRVCYKVGPGAIDPEYTSSPRYSTSYPRLNPCTLQRSSNPNAHPAFHITSGSMSMSVQQYGAQATRFTNSHMKVCTWYTTQYLFAESQR